MVGWVKKKEKFVLVSNFSEKMIFEFLFPFLRLLVCAAKQPPRNPPAVDLLTLFNISLILLQPLSLT